MPAPDAAVTARIPILAFATQGAGGDDETRLRHLLSNLPVEILPFRRGQKKASALQVLRKSQSHRYSLTIMEGTGCAGGLAVILGKWLYGARYIISSGDAVAPFLTSRWPLGKWLFTLYERLLCGNSAGFIGWTPYLVGRAKDMGASRGMTAAGWAPHPYSPASLAESRSHVRRSLGIPDDAIVFGITGSLIWSERWKYCYGHELVQAVTQTKNPRVCVLVVGDGGGLSELRKMAGSKLNTKVFLPGRVLREQVPAYLAAMDVGSLPQSVDNLGSFRYTTKLPEYFSARLPIVTNQIPAAYDLDDGQMWRLPGKAPWDARFVRSLIDLMDQINPAHIEQKRSAIPSYLPEFDCDRQIARTTTFVEDILEDLKTL